MSGEVAWARTLIGAWSSNWLPSLGSITNAVIFVGGLNGFGRLAGLGAPDFGMSKKKAAALAKTMMTMITMR